MSVRFPVIGAFIIVEEGYLLDAGIIELVKNRPVLYRLPPKGPGKLREHLGMLFTIFHLYGIPKSIAQKRKKDEKFLIYPNEWKHGFPKSSDFPGLVRYIKRYYQESAGTKSKELAVEMIDQYSFEGHEVFDYKAFNRLFRVHHKAGTDHGIIQTGAIDPQDMFLLDTSKGELLEIYDALNAFNRKRLEQFCLKGEEAERLIDLFRIAVKNPHRSKVFGQWNVGELERACALPEACKKVTPANVRDNISELVGKILSIDDLIVPDDWDRRIHRIKKATLKAIFTNLAIDKYETKVMLQISTLLHDSLLNACNKDPEAELLMIMYYMYFGDYNMAIAKCRKYCQEYNDDSIGWILLGKSLLSMEQNTNAKKSFNKAFRLGQKICGSLGIAYTYAALGDKEEALSWIEKALKYSPTDKAALTMKAKWLLLWNDANKPVKILNEILKRNSNYQPAKEERVSCLYSLNQYNDLITEANEIIAAKTGRFEWIKYLLAASLYCLNDYKKAKKVALEALEEVRGSTTKGYLHIILRKIAVQEKSVRKAIRHSATVCRLAPERQASWLWLAADLEWGSHKALAKPFWNRQLDLSTMDKYEVSEVALLYILFEKWEKALTFVLKIESIEDTRKFLNQLPMENLGKLCVHIQLLFISRISGERMGDWKEPFEFIKKCCRALPDNELFNYLYHSQVAELACQVDKDSFQSWLKKWDYIPVKEICPRTRCVLVWNVYTCWSKGTHFPGIAKVIWPLGWEAVEQIMASPVAKECDAFIVCITFSVLVGFGHKTDLSSYIKKFTSWFSVITPKEAPAFCQQGLTYLIHQLVRYEQLEAATCLYPAVLELLDATEDIDNQAYLVYTASVACFAISVCKKPDYWALDKINHLEKIIRGLLGQYETIDIFISGILECHKAKVLWLVRQDSKNDFSIRVEIEKTLSFLDGWEPKEEDERDRRICDHLGSLATILTNAFYDKLVEEILEILDKRFGTSDTLARLLAFHKRSIKKFQECRPVTINRFIRSKEKLDSQTTLKVDHFMIQMALMLDASPDVRNQSLDMISAFLNATR